MESKQILALYATFYQAYMSFFRFDNSSEYISFFKQKEDEMNCLRDFIALCHQENIPVQFHEIPPVHFLRHVYHYFFKKQSISTIELSTAAYFCQEILDIAANPSISAMKQCKFFPNYIAFSKHVLFTHLTKRDIHNARLIDFYNHTFFWTSFSLKEILEAKRRLVKLYIEQ